MDKNVLLSLQDEASHAYGRVPQSEAAAWAQVMVQAEIALQLAKLNEKLEKITERGGYLDFIGDQIRDVSKDMAALNLSDSTYGRECPF